MTIDTRQFRNCLGRFATGITIITTEVDGETHGMTANGFMSVSLNPPLVLISLGNHTKMHQYLSQTMRFGVSILDETQQDLCKHFAGRTIEGLEVAFIQQQGMSLIDGAIAHLVTRVVNTHAAGDHTLYVAEVEYFDYRDGQPLLFFCGDYQRLAAEV